MDTIVAGEIRYSDLMPDCTIEDILSMVWGKFGAVYFVDSNTKNVRIKLIKDIFNLQSRRIIRFSSREILKSVFLRESS